MDTTRRLPRSILQPQQFQPQGVYSGGMTLTNNTGVQFGNLPSAAHYISASSLLNSG